MRSYIRGLGAEAWVLIALTIAAAALRFATLTSQSYWFDEALTAHELALPFHSMLHSLATHETNPPLYYVVMWVWARVFGTGEVSLRFVSALAGTAVVPIAYGCGRELVSRRAGLLSAALAALSPFMVWYSQEARGYMLLVALTGASLLFAARTWSTGNKRDLTWWAVSSGLAILTHFFAGFLIFPEAAWLLWGARSAGQLRRLRTPILWAVGFVVAVQLALVPLVIHDTAHPIASWITSFPRSVRIKQVPIEFAFGSLYRGSIINYGLWVGLGTAVVAAAMLIAGGSQRERRGAAVAGALAAFVLLVPLLLAVLGHDYIDTRNLMPAWIPAAVVVAAACTATRLRAAGSAIAAVVLGLFVIAGVKVGQSAQYQRPDWRAVARVLGTAAGNRAIVAYDGAFAAGPLAVYMPGVPWLPAAQQPASVSEIDIVGSTWQTTPRVLPPGVKLLSSRSVDTMLVERFSLVPVTTLAPSAIATRAASLLSPAPAAPSVLIQRETATRRAH